MKTPTLRTRTSPAQAPAHGGATLLPPSAEIGFVDRLAGAHLGASPLQAKLAPLDRARQVSAPPIPEGRGGAPLDATVRASMEAAFGTSFTEVRVHRDGAAEAIGALAFTRGTDIHFATGAYAPGTSRGRELLGHELAHVQQQRAGRLPASASAGGVLHHDPSLEAEADRLGSRAAAGQDAQLPGDGARAPSTSAEAPIQAKLGWSRRTLEERSDKGHWFRSTAWNQMLKGLDRYNTKSEETIADVPLLKRLQSACISWIEDHDDESATVRVKRGMKAAVYEETTRGMVQRLAYVDIPNEIGALTSGLREGISEKALIGGKISDVSLTRFGDKTRVFKDEQSTTSGTVAIDIGVSEVAAQHPLFGSRAVASWRIDQLISASILTKTQFAQRRGTDNKQIGGIASEIAGGDALQHSHKLTTLGSNHSFHTYDEVDYDDSNLQRQLSTLQLIDALTGQSDRHGGNYFVNLETKTPTVTGIDNDASFGQSKTTIDKPVHASDHSKGIPPYVDHDVAERILALKESLIQDELRELLPPKAIRATIERLGKLKAVLGKMRTEGRLLRPDEWTAQTSQAHTGENSYLGRGRQFAERAKEQACFIPHGGDRSTKGRRSRRKRFVSLRAKLERFSRWSTKLAQMAKDGETLEDFSATNAPELAQELREAINALQKEFPGMGGETFFNRIEELIKTHLE